MNFCGNVFILYSGIRKTMETIEDYIVNRDINYEE